MTWLTKNDPMSILFLAFDLVTNWLISLKMFHASLSTHSSIKGLLNVGDEVLNILQAHRQTYQVVCDAQLFTLVSWHRGMGLDWTVPDAKQSHTQKKHFYSKYDLFQSICFVTLNNNPLKQLVFCGFQRTSLYQGVTFITMDTNPLKYLSHFDCFKLQAFLRFTYKNE